MKKSSKIWTATKHPTLYRHKSGIYHARLTVNGRRTWRSLKTDVQSIALEELRALKKQLQTQEELNPKGEKRRKGSLTFREAAQIWLERIQNDPSRKKRTKQYWGEILAALEKHSPKLCARQIGKVTQTDCEVWASSFASLSSPSRYNNTLSALRNILEVGIEMGERLANPASQLKRLKTVEKDLTGKLPDRETFQKWVQTIRTAGSRWSQPCADLVEFLAYSGLRIGEAGCVQWKHIDFEKEEIVILGDPEEGTKNRSIRRVPMIGKMKALLERFKERPISNEQDDKLLQVSTARAAMERASEKLGIPHLTHHDLRHLFATVCIESGVDIPTVAKWLGHKDGGALAMRVYGHLRDEHSKSAARKVVF